MKGIDNCWLSFTRQMKEFKFNTLLAGIIFCILILLCLQFYWLTNLIYGQRVEFNKSINLALEKTITEEKRFRTDSISKAMYKWLMDTSLTVINSKTKPDNNGAETVYYVSDKRNIKNRQTVFSSLSETRPITSESIDVKKSVASLIVKIFSQSYKEYEAVYFFTNTISDSTRALASNLKLDTTRIGQHLSKNLYSYDIKTKYTIHFINLSDTAEAEKVQKEANIFTSLQTRLYKTDISKNEEVRYIYTSFNSPGQWLVGKTFAPILASLFIILFSGMLLFYFYKTIKRQKQLAVIKNDFIDNMTHELKTPIAVISAAAEAMQQFGVLHDQTKTQKYIANIRYQSAQLHTIVNKVLDISSFEKEEVSLKKTSIHLKELIGEVTTEHLLIRPGDKITIDIQSPTDVLYGDRFHLKNIFFNLVDNALKYNDKCNTIVHITMKNSGEGISITIKDNGKGIEPNYLANIFDKFFRVPLGNIHRVKGFGLGLFYVKKIIQLHGGNIYAESTPGVETTFTIYLPNMQLHHRKI